MTHPPPPFLQGPPSAAPAPSPLRRHGLPRAWRPLLVFAALSAVLVPASFGAAAARLVGEPLAGLMAFLVARIASASGTGAEAAGDRLVITASGEQLWVSADCAAVPAYATLLALELAGGGGIGRRLAAATASCLGFFGVNLGRILSLLALRVHRPDLFDALHEVGWNAALFVLVTGFVVLRLNRHVAVAARDGAAQGPPAGGPGESARRASGGAG